MDIKAACANCQFYNDVKEYCRICVQEMPFDGICEEYSPDPKLPLSFCRRALRKGAKK